MNTRISAIVCLLCILGYADLTWADDPYSQRVADPYAISPDPPNMSSGTLEPYFSLMAGVAIPFSQDATFQDGTQPTVIQDVDYQMKHSWGGSAGIWFPTRNKLWGFDLGFEITGYVWYPDVACCRDFFNNDPTGANNGGFPNRGTTTEISGVYVGPNFLIRYPMAISESYPNGRWHPYVGIGVGAHQMGMKPGGFRGGTLVNVDTTQRDTTIGFQGVGGIKAHLFKYVAAFVEAKYLYAHHNGLSSDRFAQSPDGGLLVGTPGPFVNPYSSTIDTIFVHAGLSIHFDWKP
jgi:opacity protein-like surface antigen